jgi:hypothetical protein
VGSQVRMQKEEVVADVAQQRLQRQPLPPPPVCREALRVLRCVPGAELQ